MSLFQIWLSQLIASLKIMQRVTQLFHLQHRPACRVIRVSYRILVRGGGGGGEEREIIVGRNRGMASRNVSAMHQWAQQQQSNHLVNQ